MEREIKIFDLIGNKAAVATDDGKLIFNHIDRALGNIKPTDDVKIILDFKDIDIITSTFLNAATGQLYGKYPTALIQKHLEVRNLAPEDMALLKKVNDRAKNYFDNPAPIAEAMKEVLEGE